VAMKLGGTVQLAAAHCPNERTLNAKLPTMPQPAATMIFTPQCSPATTHYFL